MVEFELELEMKCHLPAEWDPQSGVMLTWPHAETYLVDNLDDIHAVFVDIVRHITRYEKCIISCHDESHEQHIYSLLHDAGVSYDQVGVYISPSNAIWARDHGPISIIRNDNPVLLDFTFNGLGSKYPAKKDNVITRHLHAQNAFGKIPLQSVDLVLEGGSIDVDGKGTLMTTSRCLLSPERNPNKVKADMANALYEAMGVAKILWLDHGYLAGDDTDGHIDMLARFVNPQTICYIECDDPRDQHFRPLKEMEEQLRSFRNDKGEPYQLVPLPWPEPKYAKDGQRLPVTYTHFLIINEAVLVPAYHDPLDEKALTILGHCFPRRKIIGVNMLPLMQWKGRLHGMAMHLPKGII